MTPEFELRAGESRLLRMVQDITVVTVNRESWGGYAIAKRHITLTRNLKELLSIFTHLPQERS